MRTLFISENLSKGSHTEDLISGIEKNIDLIEKINYTEMYEFNGKKKFESYIFSRIEEENISLLIFALGSALVIDVYFLKELNEKTDCKIITMFSDSEHLFEYNDRYYAQASDLTWLLSPACKNQFELYGINTVWTQGFDINRYYKRDIIKEFDVSFIGGIERSNRKEYIDYLEKNGIKVELAGYGTKRGLVSVEEKNDIVYKSKINLNFTGVENDYKKIFQRIKQPKGRPMEVSMLGSFTLSEYSYSIDEMFNINDEIDIFHTKEELVEKVKYYLNNDELRMKMENKAYQKALNNYESKNSFFKVLEALDNIKNVNKTYYLDEEFCKKFVSKRFYYMTKFFLHGRFNESYLEMQTIKKYKNLTIKNFYFDIPRGIFHFLDEKFNIRRFL